MKTEQLLCKSPFGNWLLTSYDNYLIRVDLITEEEKVFNETLSPLLIKTKEQLTEYFKGERKEFDIPLKLIGTDFQIRVWEELLKIPYGTYLSYQKLAINVGNEKAFRAVGQANNKNPISIIVPCHRVFAKNEKLVGFGNGIEIQKALLELEGQNISQRNKGYYVNR